MKDCKKDQLLPITQVDNFVLLEHRMVRKRSVFFIYNPASARTQGWFRENLLGMKNQRLWIADHVAALHACKYMQTVVV